MNATSLINASSVSEIFSAAMNNESSSSSSSSNTSSVYVPTAPVWMVEFMAFRQRLFLQTVEPIIIHILGPIEDDNETEISSATNTSTTMEHYETSSIFGENNNNNYYEHELLYNNETMHRRLGFLPEYVENASSLRETSMSFATLITLFGTMSCLLLIFLSCFYHNQKTSPLFISPRRHRLPKLVPPPLPVEGYFDWVSLNSTSTEHL
jgi:hypothetical protein